MQKKSFGLIALLLAGCALGPDYQAPATAVADKWIAIAPDAQVEVEQEWWKHFNDPVLNQLIAKASVSNWDLKIAEARIKEARAARAGAGNALLPTVNTVASGDRQANRLSIGNSPFDLSKPFNTFQAGFDASWELDLFGAKRRSLESATADLQAAQAAGDAARVSLLAESGTHIRRYTAIPGTTCPCQGNHRGRGQNGQNRP